MTATFKIDAIGHGVAALWQDARYAIRSLARSPGLTFTVVLSLALGVGANAAVFTVLDRVFFQPPPGVQSPASLRRLYAHQVSQHATELGPDGKVTPFLTTRDMLDLSKAAQGIAHVEGDYLYRRGRTAPDGHRVLLTFVSPGYFDLLGVRIQRGRSFSPEEARLPGPGVPVAVISDRFWRTRFAAGPSVLGTTLQIDDTKYTIIGVAAPEFEGIELESIDLWAPLANVENGNITSLRVIARLDPHASATALDQRLSAQYRATHLGDVRVEAGSGIIAAPILAARGPTLHAVTVLRIPGMTEKSISLLARLGIVGFLVLAIAIANVASLLLMRAMRRRYEIAVRLALGASAQRLIAQAIIESVLLSMVAGIAALGASMVAGKLLRIRLAAGIRWTDTVVDERVVALAMTIAVAGGCLAGLAPAMFARRADVATWLKGSTIVKIGSRVRSTLLVAQAALCMALLATAGVLLQSLRRAGDADRGFDTDRTILVSLPANRGSAESELSRARDAMLALPAVEAIGRSSTGLTSPGFRTKVGLTGHDTVGLIPDGPWVDFVDTDWGRAVGVRLIGGRWFDSSSTRQPVAVINEALAKALYRGRNIAGTCIRVREPEGSCREVIGVVRDLTWDLNEASQQRVYIPLEQAWTRPPTTLIPNYLIVRTRTAPTSSAMQQLHVVIASTVPDKGAGTSVARVTEMLEPQLRPWRIAVTLFLVLGALGLAAAAAGIYGLVSFEVTQRTREIGVRMALGATSPRILHLVVAGAMRVVLYGVAGGALAAVISGRIMASLLYATSPYDPTVLVGTAVVVAAVTAIASIVPAWRATRLNPVVALAAE
jgi:predicted permease